MNKRIVQISVLVIVLAALLAVVGTALANPPTGGNQCGNSDFVTGANGLKVKKDVYCEKERLWNWVIQKIADYSDLTLSTGQSFVVNYQVTASATAADNNFKVSGTILIFNPTSDPIYVESVTDSLGTVTDCNWPLPFALPSGWSIVCNYNGTPSTQPSENVATVIGGGETIQAVAPIDWSLAATTETDECADVTDSYAGFLGTVCAGQQTTFTFTYTRMIGPYAVCGNYTVDNTASFLTNDTGATGSSSWMVNVNVPCAGGCTLTPGYWKTHSEFGPAPYDDTWAQLPNGASTPFYLSGQTWYQVFWTAPQGNAYYILAHAYMASRLNILNGASTTPDVDAALAWSEGFFNTYTPSSTLSKTVRQQAIYYADILDDYNNGLIGPGHCSE